MGVQLQHHDLDSWSSMKEQKFVWLKLWMLVELVFMLYTAWRHYVLSGELSKPQPYPTSRKRLFHRILDYLIVHKIDFKEFVSGWFLGAPFEQIRQGNLEEFMVWAFFATSPDKINAQEELEVQWMISTLCGKLRIEIPPGFAPDLPCMRLNLDPIKYYHRPLLYYVAIALLQQASAVVLLICSFQRSKCQGVSYWWRPSSSSLPAHARGKEGRYVQEPLLFFHGIGIGLAPYLYFLLRMCGPSRFSNGGRDSEWSRRGVLLVEVPAISQSMSEHTPTPQHMLQVVQAVAKQKNITRFGSVVGHSFGTVAVAWLVRKAPNLVGSAVFMDPVCFLLFEPDVAYNFIYRKPKKIMSFLVKMLASRELYTANAIHRHFWWYSNLLWFDEIGCPALVVLSGSDDIVNASKVYDYLTKSMRESSHEKGRGGKEDKGKGGEKVALQTDIRHHPDSSGCVTQFGATPAISTLWFHNMRHAQILLRPDLQDKVIESMRSMEIVTAL